LEFMLPAEKQKRFSKHWAWIPIPVHSPQSGSSTHLPGRPRPWLSGHSVQFSLSFWPMRSVVTQSRSQELLKNPHGVIENGCHYSALCSLSSPPHW
jgi:hypothetical protein